MEKKVCSSVIIPCYNCSKTILHCLESLENQKTRPAEVIIVDDASTDNTFSLLGSFAKKTSLDLRILKQNHSGPAAARNLGAKKAKSGIIVFLDSDCIAPKKWLEQMLAPLPQGYSGVSCPYRTKNVESLVARYVGLEIAFRHEKMLGRNVDCFGSYSAAFFKKDFFSVGGFDESFETSSGEDFALTFALHAKGKKLFFTDRTFVYHFHPDSLQRFLKQQFWRGYWRVPLYLQNKKRIFKGESYAGSGAQAQFLLSTLFIFSVPLAFFSKLFPLLAFGLLLASNLPFGAWGARWEKKFIFIASLIASLRSIAGTLGALWFFASKLFSH